MPRYYEDKPEGGACTGVKEDLGACLLQSACVLQVADLGGRAQPRLAPCCPAREVTSRVEVARPLLTLDRSLELSSPVLTDVRWEVIYYPHKGFVNIEPSSSRSDSRVLALVRDSHSKGSCRGLCQRRMAT